MKSNVISKKVLEKLRKDIDRNGNPIIRNGNPIINEGRPRKEETLNVRLEPWLWHYLFEILKDAGMDRSQLIRRLIEQEAKKRYVIDDVAAPDFEKCNTINPIKDRGGL